jgi:hypothetical protein
MIEVTSLSRKMEKKDFPHDSTKYNGTLYTNQTWEESETLHNVYI